jgi:YidC/Oxa1 family membrane protein insertase
LVATVTIRCQTARESDFMEKRVLLAVVLSFVVLYGYEALFPPPKPQPKPNAAPASASAPSQAPAAAPQPAQSSQPQAEAPQPPAAPAAAAIVSDTEERDVVVENSSIRAQFTTRGGVLKSWRLKKYQDESHQPLELVPTTVPPGSVRPFSLAVDDAAVTSTLRQALYKPSATELHPGSSPATLTFEYQDASGLTARKEFVFTPDSPYLVHFTADVRRGDSALVPTVEWGPALGSGIVPSSRSYNPAPQPIFYRDGKVTRVKPTKIQENARQEGVFGFAGVDDHYFLTAAVPVGQPLVVTYRPLDVPIPGGDGKTVAHFVEWSARYGGAPRQARFFMGPKDFDVLASVDRDLVRSIDFGIFAWIVVPLLRALKWVNGYIGNYGWSIIALTVIINLVMFPLRHKSVVSMRRMQEIQPEVKAIQERYSKLKMSDPAKSKMNVELMNLYRERGVNPASGCVPMLLTLPVLFAFYSMLSVAIELRGAPFIFWIKDLSVHDPLFITPVLMGITQFVQTRMTPSTADPTQQKMMMFMPIVMMMFFIWAPSGLVLYWTASNAWAIGQQVLTNKLIGPPAQHAVRPPAERKIKNAGGGKSDQASKERT